MGDNGHGGAAKFNRLKDSTSPYLQQHASNPVDWYPWGEEAFEKARAEDKPVFLSIGYSTCHWCHVMAHESFEDSAVAAMMNETFVSIKVDREERPDIDKVYMSVCQLLTGQGGWPLTVIMTPEKIPFFAGTYFPKNGRFGRIGMTELVPRIAELWRTSRDDLEQDARKVADALREASAARGAAADLTADVLEQAFEALATRFDTTFGGFGEAPKFPTPHNIYFLLRWWKRSGSGQALAMAEQTLEAMRRGGIYDHVGFGFHRYSTDRHWLVPHFEKMLYDQALIAIACLETWQATGREIFAETARGIFTYVLRDLRSPEGAFYSAEDADSEGEEGRFYLWKYEELEKLLEPEELELVEKVWGVTAEGNYHEEAGGRRTGDNVLHMSAGYAALADELGVTEKNLRRRLEEIRGILYEARAQRVRPGLDNKVLADWNALMAAALARGAVLLGEDEYAGAAAGAVDFILERMTAPDGRLFHRWAGGGAGVTATLDDYAFLVWALLELYEADFNPGRLHAAKKLTEQMLEHYWDSESGGFYFTADDSEELLVRQRELYDGATPSGNSVAALNLLKLARITGDERFAERAEQIGGAFGGHVRNSPAAFTQFLCALDFATGPSHEVVVASGDDRDGGLEMARRLQRPFAPNKVVLLGGDAALEEIAPFTGQMGPLEGKPAAYVCVDYACELPTTDTDKAIELLTR
ncbi:MAG: thioredoxin domain-containing protein [Candidatus Glassbacteria bacterium]|nr:thioredoxin domain-containing protein [Candidatus Glassbacteria bacterium]